MGHYPACEKATSRTCVCKMCCGSLHGWTEAVQLARQPESEARREFQQKVQHNWNAAFAGDSKAKPIFKNKRAAIDRCRAEIIDLLAAKPATHGKTVLPAGAVTHLDYGLPPDSADDELWAPDPGSISTEMSATAGQLDANDSPGDDVLADEVESMAERVIGATLVVIVHKFDGPIPDHVKVALADHFWCDLLAHFAHAIDEGLRHIDSVPDRIADWVMTSREQSGWRPLEDWVVRAAAKSLWKRARTVTFLGLLNRPVVLPATRLLAVLICKAPERHRAVVEYCLDPLDKQLLAAIKDRLVEVLWEWLPRMRESTV